MRKGISPLVAAVILIAATMSVAGILSFWTTSFVKTKLTETKNATDETRCLGSEFKFYSGSLDNTSSTLYLVLENVRSYDLELTDLYLFDASDALLETITLDEKLEGNSLLPLTKSVNASSFASGIIKTTCPEVSVEFSYSQVTD